MVRFLFSLGLSRFFSCFTSTLVNSTGNGLNRWLTHPFFFSEGLGDSRFPWSWHDISNSPAGVMECWNRWYSWFVLDVRGLRWKLDSILMQSLRKKPVFSLPSWPSYYVLTNPKRWRPKSPNFTLLARNNHLPWLTNVRLTVRSFSPPPPPPSSFYLNQCSDLRVLKPIEATRKRKKSKQGFEVTHGDGNRTRRDLPHRRPHTNQLG